MSFAVYWGQYVEQANGIAKFKDLLLNGMLLAMKVSAALFFGNPFSLS